MLVLCLAALTAAAQAQPPRPAADSHGPGRRELPPGFAGQLSEARTVLADSWAATAKMIGQTSSSVRLLYEAGPAARSGPASVEPIAFPHLRDLHRSCTVGIPPDSELEMEVVEARVAARLHAPEAAEQFAGLAPGPAALGERGLMRRQEVVAVGFGPRLEGGELTVFDRIEVELRFSASPGAGRRSRPDKWGELLYRNTLVNYEQARSWRLPAAGPGAGKAADEQALDGGVLRLTVRSNGMYKVTGADLAEAGIDLETVAPERLRMLYGGGRVLGLQRAVIPGIYRREVPVLVEDGGDGRFDAGDFLLFHGEATQRWEYGRDAQRYFWRQNPFTEENVYFLDTGAEAEGLRMRQDSGAPEDGSPRRTDSYRERIHLEDDRIIRNQSYSIKSGYDWYWEDFGGNARNFSVIVREAVPGTPVDIRVRFWGSKRAVHRFDLFWNDELAGKVSMDSLFVATLEAQAPQGPKEGLNQLGVFQRDNKGTRLDWIEVEFDRRLSAEGGELAFAWPPSAMPLEDGDAVTAEFVLSGFAEEGKPRIFEISAQGWPREIVAFDWDETAGTAVFQDRFGGAGVPPRYIASVPSRWKRPADIRLDFPSRLRTPENGADYIVLTHADFRAAADRLAEWRAADDRFGRMRTLTVDVEDVYDEFSGGLVDPMAIRTFVDYAVDNWDPAPWFICLMGDGTYDYKNSTGTSHPNWMPAYQEGVSMFDEWYVRVEGEDRIPDLAIGRLAVQSATEAEGVVDKLISYDSDPEIGPWQSRVLLVADDLRHPSKNIRESYFIIDAESLARRFFPADLDLVKLYIAQFPLEGSTKPQARDAFVRRFNEGALIVTYLGHGSLDVLAHEKMFLLSRDADLIDNGRRLPFMYTAASQVGVFDDPNQQSIPEVLMNRADGGVIGFISAARVGFHASNMYLAREFHRLMYRSEESDLPLGLALTIAKQNTSGNHDDRTNMQRYCLIGDPALRLARPRYAVALEVPDSVRALEEVRVAGRILDPGDGRRRTSPEPPSCRRSTPPRGASWTTSPTTASGTRSSAA